MLNLITQDGLSEYDAWNRSSVELVQLSKVYISFFVCFKPYYFFYLIFLKFYSCTFVNNAYLAYLHQHLRENCINNQKALEEMFELYLLYGILEVNLSWFLRVRSMKKHINYIKN